MRAPDQPQPCRPGAHDDQAHQFGAVGLHRIIQERALLARAS